MTLQDHEYDEILSRVLHSTLEAIDPAGDGLSKIQQRIAEPWLKRQWSLLRHEFTSLGWLIFVRTEPHLNGARSSLASFAESSGRRLRSTSQTLAATARVSSPGRHKNPAGHEGLTVVLRKWLGPTMAWLRPALAVGGAVVLVVVGVFAVGQARQAFNPQASPSGNSIAQGTSTGTTGGNGGAYGQQSNNSPQGSLPPAADRSGGHGEHANQASGGANNAPAAAASCTPTAAPSPSPSVSATPSPSPSPSATASPTPSPTPSPTASSSAPAPGPGGPQTQPPGPSPSCGSSP